MKNRVCMICREQYSYCPSCSEDSGKPLWMTLFCCEDCHTVYEVLNDYGFGKLSARDAFDLLKGVDMGRVVDKTSVGVYQKICAEVQKADTEKKKKAKIKSEPQKETVDNIEM